MMSVVFNLVITYFRHSPPPTHALGCTEELKLYDKDIEACNFIYINMSYDAVRLHKQYQIQSFNCIVH